MVTAIEAEALRATYNSTLAAIKSAKAGRQQGLENAYGLAYNAMAQAGLAQPLKRKYRRK
jgi:hypothetical protein